MRLLSSLILIMRLTGKGMNTMLRRVLLPMFIVFLGGLSLTLQQAWAQVVVKHQGVTVNVGQEGLENEAVSESGVVEDDVEIEGILIVNGSVRIDGVPIPRGMKTYRSKKSGKVYRIEWGKGDNVSVSEQ